MYLSGKDKEWLMKSKIGEGFWRLFVTGSPWLQVYWFPFEFQTKSECTLCIFESLVQAFKNCHFTIYSYFHLNSNSHYNLTLFL